MGEVWGPLEDAPRPPTEARAQCTVIAVCETRTVCMWRPRRAGIRIGRYGPCTYVAGAVYYCVQLWVRDTA